ncbi:MAG TPA: hypothetical protein VM715_14400, partial [Candidatus Acidoferrum sp.]|nr:hypothetical protein [Candidatus Acidoferrum sp.]
FRTEIPRRARDGRANRAPQLLWTLKFGSIAGTNASVAGVSHNFTEEGAAVVLAANLGRELAFPSLAPITLGWRWRVVFALRQTIVAKQEKGR